VDNPGILIIEDDEAMREVLAFNAREFSDLVSVAKDGTEGLSAFDPHVHQVVLCDLRMPGLDGMAVLRALRERSPQVLVILVTAYGDIPTAVEAMKAGAYDFLPKPFDREHLRSVLRKAVEVASLRGRVADLEQRLAWGERDIVAASRAMQEVLALVDRVAPSDVPVLLTGESGTGKELLARRLHAHSSRRGGPFVAVNCGAIPRDLLESELFGHARGAFTGAVRDHKGRFEQAHRGTLFLDEIAELAPDLQVKLLRVLEEQVVPVVGLAGGREVDVRVVAATNQDLGVAVADGRFRQDLYYRLAVVHVRVPPLRERREDIPVLVEFFLQKWGQDRKVVVEPEAMEVLLNGDWPGNVRELENACRRFCLLAEGRVTAAMAREVIRGPRRPALEHGEGTLWDLERRAIEAALDAARGNRSEAARALGIPRHVLLYRMKKFGITPPKEPAG